MGIFQNNLLAGAGGQAGGGAAAFYDYQIEQSCRFDGSPDNLEKTYSGSPTSTTTGTLSLWYKRTNIDNEDSLITSGNGSGDAELNFRILGTNDLRFNIYNGSSQVGDIKSNALFRDVSGFNHFLAAWDTSQGTASNRLKMYLNGNQITDLATSTYPSQNQNSYIFGSGRKVGIGHNSWNGSSHVKGYLAEIYGIDGTAYTPSTFGETKNGVWIPKDASSSVTFGNGGFYIKFENASDLGNDSSGNNNDYTVTGLGADHQVLDSPTFGS
jgi:hypothetical protein